MSALLMGCPRAHFVQQPVLLKPWVARLLIFTLEGQGQVQRRQATVCLVCPTFALSVFDSEDMLC